MGVPCPLADEETPPSCLPQMQMHICDCHPVAALSVCCCCGGVVLLFFKPHVSCCPSPLFGHTPPTHPPVGALLVSGRLCAERIKTHHTAALRPPCHFTGRKEPCLLHTPHFGFCHAQLYLWRPDRKHKTIKNVNDPPIIQSDPHFSSCIPHCCDPTISPPHHLTHRVLSFFTCKNKQ